MSGRGLLVELDAEESTRIALVSVVTKRGAERGPQRVGVAT
jgi:hypothetical protein